MNLMNIFTLRHSKSQGHCFFYIDDMLIIKRDTSDINATKHMLESNFDMKDIEVTNVIENLLDKFKNLDFNIVKDTNKCEICTSKE